MAANTVFDVIIIGGGPAGSTTASFLTMLGHQVLLLEKEKFPRDHVGESLLPFCYSLFEQLGVLEQMKQCFVRKPGVRFIDRDGRQASTWCFNRVIHDHTYLSFQVARADFDNLLLNNARSLGATALEERRVIHVEGLAQQDLKNGLKNLHEVGNLQPDAPITVQARGPNDQTETYRARFLIDCSGRDAFMASRLRTKKKFPELDRTALWTHYGGPAPGSMLRGGLEEGLSLIVYLGGDKKGWIWVFPLGRNRLTVGVVLNNAYIRDQKARLQEAGALDWRMALYEQELNDSPFVRRLLAGATPRQPLTIEGDYSYYTDQKYGANYALVGDAGTFIDPIFSSGVYLAMNSARLVSNAVHERLSGPTSPRAGADTLQQAYQSIEGAYKLIFKLINFFYSVNTINFAQMEAVSDVIHQQQEDAMAVGHYLLAGDFFERYEEYGTIIDMLHSPKLFKVYKKNVIARATFHATSCEERDEVVFHGL